MGIDELKQLVEDKLADLKTSFEAGFASLKQHIDDRVSTIDKRFDEKIAGLNKYYELRIKTLEQINTIRENTNDDHWEEHGKVHSEHMKSHDEAKKTTIGIIISLFTLGLSAIGFLIKSIFWAKP